MSLSDASKKATHRWSKKKHSDHKQPFMDKCRVRKMRLWHFSLITIKSKLCNLSISVHRYFGGKAVRFSSSHSLWELTVPAKSKSSRWSDALGQRQFPPSLYPQFKIQVHGEQTHGGEDVQQDTQAHIQPGESHAEQGHPALALGSGVRFHPEVLFLAPQVSLQPPASPELEVFCILLLLQTPPSHHARHGCSLKGFGFIVFAYKGIQVYYVLLALP